MAEPQGNGNGNGTSSLTGFGAKDPLATSHGDALLDQNFQSLKSKEVRDSMSPTHELKFHSMTLTQPSSTGWDVQTSSEVSPDGRAFRTETLAKTDGIEKLNGGGLAEFKGRNEQRSSASHQGDDQNYVKKASESTNTQLQEKVVFGDENSGRTEMKVSSTSTSSSSTKKVVSSSSSSSKVEYGDEPSAQPARYLMDDQEKVYQQQLQREQREWEDKCRVQEQRILQEQLQQQRQQQEERYSESREQSNSTRNVQTQQHYEENKLYVDMDKASPEYQRHVQHLMSQPGEIISNTVEYPKPNVKMITTVKRLPDGTIVKNKRYETEQVNQPQAQLQTQTQTHTQSQTQSQRRAQDVHDSHVRNQTHSQSQPRDVVDNAEPLGRHSGQQQRPVEREQEQEQVTQSQSFSSVKKSSRRFSTETTSETVEEFDDHGQPITAAVPAAGRPSVPQSSRQQVAPPPQTSDFSTHGFPSVRPNKPTQEFSSQRPSNETEQEVVVVKSEKSRNVKQSSSSQRTIETEFVDRPQSQSQSQPQIAARAQAPIPSWEQPASPRRQPVDDYSTHGFPSVRSRPDQPDGEVIVTSKSVSRNQKASHKSQTERIIETQVDQDYAKAHPNSHTTHSHGQPPQSASPSPDSGARRQAAQTPAAGARPGTRGGNSPNSSDNTTTTTSVSRRQLEKVDAAHRAFAASLRSSSPADSTTSVGSPHHQTPRSSISSSRTYRREGREGSHDSQAPSESSRISTTTVTRQTSGGGSAPTTPKSVGKTPVVKQQQVTTTKTISNEPKSPTQKAATTTVTTTTTSTIKTGGGAGPSSPTAAAAAPTPAPQSPTTAAAPASSAPVPDNKLSQYTYTTTKPGDIFSLPSTPTPTPTTPPTINNEPTTTTTTTPLTINNNKDKNTATGSTTATSTTTSHDQEPIRKVKVSANEAHEAVPVPVAEPPCVKRQYYQLGPETVNETLNAGETIVPVPRPFESVATKQTDTKTRYQQRNEEQPEPQPESTSKPKSNLASSKGNSKSPSVERRPVFRETTFEGRRGSKPEEDVLLIEEQILIDETTFQSRPRAHPKPKQGSPEPGLPQSRAQSPEKPRVWPRQSPEKQTQPLPSKESPQGQVSPEKQLPSKSQVPLSPVGRADSPEKSEPVRAQRSEKEAPRALNPDKEPELPRRSYQLPKESSSPQKVVPKAQTPLGPALPKTSQRAQSPEKKSGYSRGSPRQTPDKEIPRQPQLGAPRLSPEKESPQSAPLQPSVQQKREDELFRSTITTHQTRTTKNNLNDEFLTNERQGQRQKERDSIPQQQPEPEPKTKTQPQHEEAIESPDGGLFSKGADSEPEPEPEPEPEAPTYRKKGLSRRETFEDRCRKILGMEEDGDTQGSYITRPNDDNDDDHNQTEEEDEKEIKQTTTTQRQKETETIEVKIEDCLDDDYDDYNDQPSRRVTETFVVRTQPKIKVDQVPQPELSELFMDGEETSKVDNTHHIPNPKEDAETINVYEETTIFNTKRPSKSSSPVPQTPRKSTRKSPSPSPSPAPSPSSSPAPSTAFAPHSKPEPETVSTSFITIDCQTTKTNRKLQPESQAGPSTKNISSPTKEEPQEELLSQKRPSVTTSTKSETERRNSRTSPTKQTTPLPKSVAPKGPRKESLTGRKPEANGPKRDSVVEETRTITTTSTTTKTGRKPSDGSASSSLKDRLRSLPRKQKPSVQNHTPIKADNVDGDTSTSPDVSPSRAPHNTERRRSSNISVHTEIIIDHTSPKSPRTERRPQLIAALSPAAARKLPVTERKESAPVPRVTRRDKADKVLRSTSENIIKVVNGKKNPHKQQPQQHQPKKQPRPSQPSKPEMSTLRPVERGSRPSKCFTTKTINLSEQLLTNSEDMIIDIQQAKSSREPSPDRIVPTPVNAMAVETGKPRYPDVVQEPDDEPRKKPQVTNITIFEEAANAYVGCQISELRSSNGLDDDILDNPMVEAPQSLDYPSSSTSTSADPSHPVQPVQPQDTDDCLLSVHEKVSRFTHSAEQVKQPRSSVPFSREFDTNARIPDNDECLLSINQKVDKFLRTAENITRQPLTPTPSRELERPSFEEMDEELRQDDCTLSVSQKVHKFIDTAEKLAPTAPQKSPRLVASIERHISRQETDLEQESEPELQSDREEDEYPKQQTQQESEEEEPLPMTKSHTTAIELKRQEDILSRPSVFGQPSPKSPPTPTMTPKQNGTKPKSTPSSSLITEERRSYRNQTTTGSTTKPMKSPQQQPSSSSVPRGSNANGPSKPTMKPTPAGSVIKRNMEHVSQQQWVISDVDVDVEMVGPAPPTHQKPANIRKPPRRSASPSPIRLSPSPSPSQSPLTSPSRSPSRLNITGTTRTNLYLNSEHFQHSHSQRQQHSGTTTKQKSPKSIPSPSPSPINQHPRKVTDTADPEPPVHVESLPAIPNGRTVATRRNVFEKTPPPTPPQVAAAPTEPQAVGGGRRPSYMDHTKSSLEHIRRDSLEINKNNYSRKSSVENDSGVEPRNPNTSVKFDVPKKEEKVKPKISDQEIEEIFDLPLLEELLETVSSYEMRRRIRAQMRLIRKNMINAETSSNTTTTTVVKTSPSVAPQPRKQLPQQQNAVSPRDRSHSPVSKTSSISLKEVRTTSNTTRRQRAEQVDSTTGPGGATPQGKPPVKPRERSASPAHRRRSSPPGKQSPGSTTRTPNSGTGPRAGAPSKPSQQEPIWADRAKVLKGPGPVSNCGSSPRKGSATSTTSTSSSSTTGKVTRTLQSTSTSSTASSSSRQASKQREEDSITSSYGVGPTDENGLPLFGIRALKKKSQPAPCETKQVTGYVIEEQFYSDNKSPPRHERRELIYSSNADELASIQKQMLVREFKKVESEEQPQSEMDARYVRRGSVKKLSEKFIRKESSSSTHSSTSQSLVSSRTGHAADAEEEETTEDSESNEVCSVIEAPQMRQGSSSTTTTRSSNTRSFLNSSADQRQVTSVYDVLERMRNADHVEEPGDTNEDREARALLNKFLGASVIMQGVESMLPPTTTGQRLNSQGVKSTRITNTYSKSGTGTGTGTSSSISKVTSSSSSSAPVTRTTCHIEEIQDEQILKQLLEQASTYEERRKIRARLRELMAEREEQKNTAAASRQEEEAEEKSSASEYEEIIEEVTDYSDDEDDNDKETTKKEPPKEEEKKVASLASVASVASKETKVSESVTKKLAKVELSEQATASTTTSSTATTDGVQKVQQGESLPAAKSGAKAGAGAGSASSSSSISGRKQNSSQVSTGVRARDKAKPETMPKAGAGAEVAGSETGSGVSRLSVPSKEDSGTESGEDLRLLAAGLRDTLRQRSVSDASEAHRSLLEEVTDALSRLESSLKQGKELAVDGGQRQALLGLVARLQSGLNAPEKLAADNNSSGISEKASPTQEDMELELGGMEDPRSDCRQSRFAKRRQRNSRHTVGVSREELADARRYMEDMLLMESNKSFALQKNVSSGAIIPPVQLYRPNQFVPQQSQQQPVQQQQQIPAPQCQGLAQLRPNNNSSNNRRPLSGDYAVSFASYESAQRGGQQEGSYSNSATSSTRFNGAKKHMMKRANTIDIPKAKAKYMADCDTDSDMEDEHDHGPHLGLKRAVQVSVKRRVQNAVPPFEPKTENDHKFLAFINKQSHQTGLGWGGGGGGGRSVSNWTHKFGNIKHTFETGAAATVTKGKPPPVPCHVPGWAKQEHQHHQQLQREQLQREQIQREQYQREQRHREHRQREQMQHEQSHRIQQEQQQQLHREHLQREQIQRDMQQREKLQREHLQREQQQQQAAATAAAQAHSQALAERQRRQEIERQLLLEQEARYEREQRVRLERECYEQQLQRQQSDRQQQLDRQRQQQEQLERQRRQEMEVRLQHQREQQQQLQQKQQQPLNHFIHAPQSVFRPIDQDAPTGPSIYKPIAKKSEPQLGAVWQPTGQGKPPVQQQHLHARLPYSNTPSPASTATSPIGLPWVAKPKVDNSDFRRKAHHFEERSLRDNLEQQPQYSGSCSNGGHGYLQRHNSLRSKGPPASLSEFKKRPSLPNAMEPGIVPGVGVGAGGSRQQLYQPPPPSPTNISFTYSNFSPVRNRNPHNRQTYRSQPCLTSAVDQAEALTNPLAAPLVLTSSNPTYLPGAGARAPTGGSSRRFDYVTSPVDVDNSPTNSPTSLHTVPNDHALTTDNTDDDLDLDSDTNMLEYRAETKVMRKPRSQTAVTVAGPRTAHLSDDDVFGRNSRAAKSLLYTMKQLGGTNGGGPAVVPAPVSLPRSSQQQGRGQQQSHTAPSSPKPGVCLSPDGRQYQAPMVEPLFPQLSSFESQRKPQYAPVTPTSVAPPPVVNYQANPTYTLPQTRNDVGGGYLGETHTSYVVTYPLDESGDEHEPESTMSMSLSQRLRRTSEHSNASSSLSLGSTSWTPNPMHSTVPVPVPVPLPATVVSVPTSAPPPVDRSTKPQLFPVQKQTNSRPRLSTRSHTIQGEDVAGHDGHHQQQPQPLPQPLRNRVMSQQSLSSSISSRTQHQEKELQQQKELQHLSELRRKSLGNVLEQRETAQRMAYHEQHEEYKSSAPADTPDIVKSSLPRENAPLLKKFGPPQRHHYVPNAYQSPQLNKMSDSGSTTTTTTSVISSSTVVHQHQQQHQQQKPSIVETPATPQPMSQVPPEDEIPHNIVFNNVSAFSSMNRRSQDEDFQQQQQGSAGSRINRLSKCDSWNQICQKQQQGGLGLGQAKYSQPGATSPGELRRCKSGHSLAVPKLYEAGIDKAQISEKQRTVAAYFSSQKSPTGGQVEELRTTMTTTSTSSSSAAASRRSAINRTKTSEKLSAAARKSLSSLTSTSNGNVSTAGLGLGRGNAGGVAAYGVGVGGGGGLSRSATMPHIANLNLLDESNVEDAFEQLMMGA
ncbi:microtubule-associated protein futsch isoform X2 [Drosophila guanche]|uniref:microtubule-associated protein futsch isoform X2 n=1 Tax=Drosophila guanche TaxID=7266 RepID=UPI001472161E|nr:microtubule-associated protein futsch isoform X2 [Drosophila guanche]